MTASFPRAFRAEWLKRKRSFASTLVIGLSLFTPAVVTIVRLIHFRALPALYASSAFWTAMWRDCWESMAIFFLPLGAILATSLIAQIEFRSNAWKQLHALPLSTATIFLSKLSVIVVMLAQFLLLFTAGVFAAGMIPSLLPGVPHPRGSFLALPLLHENGLYFLETLPIVAVQYLMALRAQNVLVPIGIGFTAWVGALAAVSSRAAIWWPYSYTIVHYLRDHPKGRHLAIPLPIHWLALTAFVLITVASYALFATNKEKG